MCPLPPRFKIIGKAALLLCAAVTVPCAAGETEAPALVVFTRSAQQASSPLLTGDGEATFRSLREDPNVSGLRIGRSAPEAVLRAAAFSLALSPAPGHVAHFRGIERTDHPNGMVSLYARDRAAGSETSIVIDGQDVLGRVRDGEGNTYRLTPLGGGRTAVYRYDTSKFRMHPPGWDPGRVPDLDTAPREPSPEDTGAEADTGDVIDVMVVYTRAARTSVGNVDAFVQGAFDDARRHYENSNIPFRLRLVHAQETAYRESGDIGVDLDAIVATNDGRMDDVHALRNRHGADLVHLFVSGTTPSSGSTVFCGVAYFSHHPELADFAFGATVVECEMIDGRTFTHEIGHNQGADHDIANAVASVFPYGHGTCHARAGWATVMAYVGINNNCSREAPYFSSPVVRYQGIPTGDAARMDNRRVLLETARIVANHRRSGNTGGGTDHVLPFFLNARTAGRQGFVRIVNRSDRAGTVTLTAIDDAGRNAGTETLDLRAHGAVHFNSRDLERGNAAKGLSGVRAGTGHWRLVLASSIDVQPLAYVRTNDGFVTRIDDVESKLGGAGNRYIVHFVNPARNRNQRSYLRLVNPGSASTRITISAHDDAGRQRGPVSLSVPAGHARHVTASDLETGQGLDGRLGEGSGKWRLTVSATRPVHVMSLLDTPTGHLTNLSGVPATTDTVTPPPPPPSDDHGDTRSEATNLALGGSRPGRIEEGDDVDYFRVQISESGTLTVYTTGGLDTEGTLEDSSGSVLGDNDDGGSGLNFRIERSADPGTYYVRVDSYGPDTGDYTLHADFRSRFARAL